MRFIHQHRSQSGYSYLIIILGLAVLGAGWAAIGEMWATASRRDKERELIHIGHQFREAIRTYYEESPGGGKRYPPSLDALILDNRVLSVKRHLRKIYRDPITGKPDWGLIKSASDSGIMGVHSLSDATPLKVFGFDRADESFNDKKRYSEWTFIYVPPPPPTTPANPSNPAPKTSNQSSSNN